MEHIWIIAIIMAVAALAFSLLKPRLRNVRRDAAYILGGGAIRADTLLTTKLFEPCVPESEFESTAEWLDFLKAHPARDYPQYWRERKEGRRKAKHRVVTDAFVADVVDVLQASAGPLGTIDDYKYHHSGTGVGAEAAGDTGLGTPVEDARVTGTQIEGVTANIYKSVATITYTDTRAITEHGLFNTAGAGGPPVTGGTLMDRTKFAAINVVNGNQIEFTFQITFSSGG